MSWGWASSPRGFAPGRLLTVPASEVANKQLGRPMPNTALLGGFAAMTGAVTLQAVVRAIAQKFSGRDRRPQHARGHRGAYEYVQREIQELARA